MRSLLAVMCGLITACGPAPAVLPDGGTGSIPMPDGGVMMPASREAVVAMLQSGEYLSWRAEPQPHRSAGPHGGSVRTFLNPPLFASLSAANATHPPGSIAVKELFTGTTRTGWAVDAKTSDGEWIFYEGFEPQLNQYFFRGTGNLCSNCHASGTDFLLTPISSFQ